MPIVVKFDPFVTAPQSRILPDATINSDGIMTAAMVRQLNSLGNGLGYNVKVFGAVADATYDPVTQKWSGTDNTAAFQATMDACKAAGGSTIYVPGKFLVKGPLTYTTGGNDDQFVTMTGLGTDSTIVIDSVGQNFLNVSNLGLFALTDIVVFGADQVRAADCNIAINAANIGTLYIDRAMFIGLGATDQIVYTDNCGHYIDNTEWLGCCVLNVNARNGCVSAFHQNGGYVNNCRYVDFGNLMGIDFSKTPNGMPKWIAVNDSSGTVGASGGNAFIIEGSYFDEGGSVAIGTGAQQFIGGEHVNSVRIVGCSFYIGIQAGININNTYNAVIEECSFNCKGLADKVTIAVGSTFGPTFIRNIHVEPGGPGGTSVLALGVESYPSGTQAIEMLNVEYDSIYPIIGAAGPPVMNITNDGVRARLRVAANPVVANTLAKMGAADNTVDTLGVGDNARLCTGVILDAGAANDVVRVVEEEGQQVIVLSDGAGAINTGDILTSSTVIAGRVAVTTTPGDHTVGNTAIAAAAVADTPTGVLWARSIY
jgi:hypothetical protein